MKRMTQRAREIGNRISQGGARALAKRLLGGVYGQIKGRPLLMKMVRFVFKPFPNLSTRLYWMATKKGSVLASFYPTSESSGDGSVPPNLSAPARLVYSKLKREAEAWNRTS